MNPAELAGKWFAGWNARDGDAVGELLAGDGTYEDPTAAMAVRAFDMTTVVESALKPFPDFKFEVVSALMTKSAWPSNGFGAGQIPSRSCRELNPAERLSIYAFASS